MSGQLLVCAAPGIADYLGKRLGLGGVGVGGSISIERERRFLELEFKTEFNQSHKNPRNK